MNEVFRWSVNGNFLTKLMRDRLWIEHRPYDEVEQTLIGCLGTDVIGNAEKKEIAKQILMGKKKLVGITSLHLEDDNNTSYPTFDLDTTSLLNIIFSLKDQNAKLNQQLLDIESEIKDIAELLDSKASTKRDINNCFHEVLKITDPIEKLRSHLQTGNLVDLVSWQEIFNTPDSTITEKFQQFCKFHGMYAERNSYGSWGWVSFYDSTTGELLNTEDFIQRGVISSSNLDIDSFVGNESQPATYLENKRYGFLAPSGTFLEGKWGSHTELAYKIIEKNLWEDEFWQWSSQFGNDGIDFLIQVKRYVLIHCPTGRGPAIISRSNIALLTRYQKEFLYDYLINDGQRFLAEQIMQEV